MKVTNIEALDIYQKAIEQFSYQVSKGQKSSKAAELFVETYKLSSDNDQMQMTCNRLTMASSLTTTMRVVKMLGICKSYNGEIFRTLV